MQLRPPLSEGFGYLPTLADSEILAREVAFHPESIGQIDFVGTCLPTVQCPLLGEVEQTRISNLLPISAPYECSAPQENLALKLRASPCRDWGVHASQR